MTYAVTDWQPETRVVVEGEGDIVRSVDLIEFVEGPSPGTTTRINYTADITLKSWYSLFTWLVAGDIKALAKDAQKGLETAFESGKYKDADST